jgi:phosphocarrier protein HPr
MTSESVTVVNQLGMHARAAAKFVHLATRFQARVRVARDRREMDGKSIMGILLLAAARGSVITISADGSDEGEAVRALVELVQSGFGEDVCSAS